MALQEAKTVELTEEFLAEEAADALGYIDDQVAADGVRRRLDRQLGLLRALPQGWTVERVESRTLGELKGHEFRVYEAEGHARGSARVRRDGSRAGVSWPGMGGGMPGHAWAHGIALMFAAIHAEAGIEPHEREVS